MKAGAENSCFSFALQALKAALHIDIIRFFCYNKEKSLVTGLSQYYDATQNKKRGVGRRRRPKNMKEAIKKKKNKRFGAEHWVVIAWLLLGPTVYSYLMAIPFIANTAPLAIIARIFDLSGLISDAIYAIFSGMMWLWELIPFLK